MSLKSMLHLKSNGSLMPLSENQLYNHWCKRNYVESNALNSWKLIIFLKLLMVEFDLLLH